MARRYGYLLSAEQKDADHLQKLIAIATEENASSKENAAIWRKSGPEIQAQYYDGRGQKAQIVRLWLKEQAERLDQKRWERS